MPTHGGRMEIFMNFLNIKAKSYLGLFFVVFVWGFAPLITLEFYKYFSPTIKVCIGEIFSFIAFVIISRKYLKEYNLKYLKLGVLTGLFLALANITQKIGLQYTTPAKYAFLENLSCVTVPILMFFLVKQKPKFTTTLASIVCLVSAFVLNGISFSSSSWGIGETLCAISGLLYGFNIAFTGVYAKELKTTLYLSTQSIVSIITGGIFSLILNFTYITDTSGIKHPIEPIKISFDPMHLLFLALSVLIISSMCWVIRTNCMKHIDAGIVATIMPFSAVVTCILSVLSGKDTLDFNLICGGTLGMIAIFLSSYDDIFKKRSKFE